MVQIQGALPEAHFVHLIRDGRDVALSAMDRAKKPLTAGQVAKRWKRRITKARRQSRKVKHYTEARYEDLILDTEPTLHKDLGLPRAPLGPGDARLPRARREAPRGDGARAPGDRERGPSSSRTTGSRSTR